MNQARVPCSWCKRPIQDHTLLEAWRCCQELEYRESSTYCRLTGPKR